MSMTKTIKISAWVHKEMKLCATKDEIQLLDFADAAMIAFMRLRKHSFHIPESVQNSKVWPKAKKRKS